MSAAAARADARVASLGIGALSGVSAPLSPGQRFVLAGIDWQRPLDARIELRARLARGAWTPWAAVSVLGHDGDRGESAAHALTGEPVWTGAADTLQLRSSVPVEGLNLHLVLAAAVTAPAGDGSLPRRRHGERLSAHEAGATAELPLASPQLPAGPGQPPIIARAAWAERLRPRVAPVYGDVRMAFVHHSVNANGYAGAQVPAMLRSIYYFHTHVRGWNDFGYNFAVDAYGRIWEGRAGGIDRPVVGAQAGGYNSESFGVVLLGDFAASLPTSAARAALARLVAWKLALHGTPVSGRVTVEVDPSGARLYTRFRPRQRVSLPRVAGHRDGCTTDCPGADMYANGMPALRTAVAGMAGRQVRLTLEPGPAPGSAYSLAPYPIAPGTRVRPATYLEIATVTTTFGRRLVLHGFLRTLAGTPLPDAPVLLQDLSASRDRERETVLASMRTARDGLWFATLSPRSNLLLRALHPRAPAAVSPLLAVGVGPELTLTVSPAGAGAVRATGTVTPAKGKVVLEAAPLGGRRREIRRRIVDAHGGSFDALLRLPRGRYWISAHTGADAAHIEGASPRVAARVR